MQLKRSTEDKSCGPEFTSRPMRVSRWSGTSAHGGCGCSHSIDTDTSSGRPSMFGPTMKNSCASCGPHLPHSGAPSSGMTSHVVTTKTASGCGLRIVTEYVVLKSSGWKSAVIGVTVMPRSVVSPSSAGPAWRRPGFSERCVNPDSPAVLLVSFSTAAPGAAAAEGPVGVDGMTPEPHADAPTEATRPQQAKTRLLILPSLPITDGGPEGPPLRAARGRSERRDRPAGQEPYGA